MLEVTLLYVNLTNTYIKTIKTKKVEHILSSTEPIFSMKFIAVSFKKKSNWPFQMQYLNAIYHEKQLLKDGAFIYNCFVERN